MNAPFRGLLLWLPLASLLAQAPPRDLDPILVGRSNPFPPRGEIVDVAVQDGIAYCAVEGYGLAIYGAPEPAHPMFLGAHETSSEGAWGRARAIATSGTYACVAGESLSILDVSNPEEPWLVSRVNHTWDGGLGNVVVAGRYAYATFDGGLQVIDLNDPAQPQLLGQVAFGRSGTTETPRDLVVAGDYAYIASNTGDTRDRAALHIIRISDPNQLVYVGGYDNLARGGGWGIAVQGAHAFVADDEAGLQVLDVSDPTSPRPVGSLPLPGQAAAVALWDGVAFVRVDFDQAQVYAVSVEDPTNPRLLGSTEPFHSDTLFSGRGLATSGPGIYVAAGRAGLRVIDAGDPAKPRLLGAADTDGFPYDVALRGHHAIVAEGGSGLQIIDASDPNGTRRVGSHATDGEARHLAVEGDLAYTVSHRWDESANQDRCSLEIFDLSEVAKPRRLGRIQLEKIQWVQGLSVFGNRAHLIGGGETNWAEIIDVSNPASPAAVGALPLACPARAVVVKDTHAYLATECGLDILDLQDPASPRLAARLSELGDVWDLASAGDWLYAISATQEAPSQWISSFSVLNVTAPEKPHIMGRLSGVYGKIVAGVSRACVLAGRSVAAIDLTDAARPHLAATALLPSQPQAGVPLDEHRVLVIEGLDIVEAGPLWTTGISVIDFRRWANPQRIATGALPSNPERSYNRVLVAGHTFAQTWTRYVENSAQGILETVDLSVPERSAVIGAAVVSETIWDLAVQGTLVYLATGISGLQIFDLGHPQSPTRLGGIKTGWTAGHVSVSGRVACVKDKYNHLSMIDVGTPAEPRLVGEYSTPSDINGIAQMGSLALVLADGLRVLDLATPSNPKLVAQLPTISSWSAMAFEGTHAFLVVESWDRHNAPLELVVLDFEKPSEPAELSRTALGFGRNLEATGLTVLHGFVYVLTRDRWFYAASGLEVFDVSNPVHPARVGGNSSFSGHAVVNDGDRVLVASERSLTVLHPYIPLQFDLMVHPAGGTRFSLTGPPDWPLRVQRSADLKSWQDWQSVTLGQVPVEVSDPEAVTQPRRFYRAVVP